MAIFDFMKMFKRKNNSGMNYAQFINGEVPIFTQFGESIYANDVVQVCCDIIATECSKLSPKHIRTDNNNMQTVPNSSINRLFKVSPNPLMTTKDFLEKVIWKLMLDYNSFIYPTFENKTDGNGKQYREYKAFYPLNPSQVDFLQDEDGKLYVQFYFQTGINYTIPYEDVIHIRKKYSLNEIMGGGTNGQPDNEALLKTLEINDIVLQGIEKALKSSLNIRGIFKIHTTMDDAKQQKERLEFEKKLANNETGTIAMDVKGDYIPIISDPKIIEKDTLEFLNNKVLPYFRVSLPIFKGEYTEEEYQAFYESALEPIIIGLGQAFTKTLFTPNELNFGNEIVFYQRNMAYLSMQRKLEFIKIVGEQGLLSDNEKLEVLGYPPIKGGERITQSLNYIDKTLVNDYQRKGGEKSEPKN